MIIRFKSRIRGTIKWTFWSGYLILMRKSKRCLSRKLLISAKNGIAAMRPAVTFITLSLDVVDIGSKIRAVQIFIYEKRTELLKKFVGEKVKNVTEHSYIDINFW